MPACLHPASISDVVLPARVYSNRLCILFIQTTCLYTFVGIYKLAKVLEWLSSVILTANDERCPLPSDYRDDLLSCHAGESAVVPKDRDFCALRETDAQNFVRLAGSCLDL